jgi:hypothetical protein
MAADLGALTEEDAPTMTGFSERLAAVEDGPAVEVLL